MEKFFGKRADSQPKQVLPLKDYVKKPTNENPADKVLIRDDGTRIDLKLRDSTTPEHGQAPGTPGKEKKKFTAVMVDTTDVMKSQTRDAGNAAMTMAAPENPDDLKGMKKFIKGEFWRRTGQKIWKHGLWRDYYRNKEVAKARAEVMRTGNMHAGDGRDQASGDRFVADVIDQFSSEYDEVIHKEAGEVRVRNEEIANEEKVKDAVKKLIVEYAAGRIEREAFIEQEKRIFKDLKATTDGQKVRKKEDVMHASNFLKIADQVRYAMRVGEFLENEDFEIDLIYGKSKAGVRTEANFTRAERLAEKLSHTKLGSLVNETTLAASLSIASTVGMKLTQSGLSFGAKVLPLVGSAAVGSWFAKIREAKKVQEERRQHAREMAKGEKFDPARMERRSEMEKSRYKTESATDIISNLRKSNAALLENQATLTPEMFAQAMAGLAAIEARISLSDRKNIDLVAYSDTTKVIQERKEIDMQRIAMKVRLSRLFDTGKFKDVRNRSFDDYLDSLTNTQENGLMNGEIDAKDRIFDKMKKERSNQAARKAFVTGLVIGTAMQEAFALVTDQVGIGEEIFNHNVNIIHGGSVITGAEHFTALGQLGNILNGGSPGSAGLLHAAFTGSHIKVFGSDSMVQNPADGTYSFMSGGKVIADHLTTNPDGTLTANAENILHSHGVNINTHSIAGSAPTHVTAEDYIKNHPAATHEMHRDGWYDENTPMYPDPAHPGHLLGANLNEIKTQIGLDAHGNTVVDIGHMQSDGSFHVGTSADVKQLLADGKVKVLISLSQTTQHQVLEVTPTFNASGQLVIDQHSEIGKIAFANGKFTGRFLEIGQDNGNNHFTMLSTAEGPGITNITDTVPTSIPEQILEIPGNDYDLPPFIPLVPRTPLEKLERGKLSSPKGPKPTTLREGWGEYSEYPRQTRLLEEKKELKRLMAGAQKDLDIIDGEFTVIDAPKETKLLKGRTKNETEGGGEQERKEKRRLEDKKRKKALLTRIKDLEKELEEAKKQLNARGPASVDGVVVDDGKSGNKEVKRLRGRRNEENRKLIAALEENLRMLRGGGKVQGLLEAGTAEEREKLRLKKIKELERNLKLVRRKFEEARVDVVDGEIIEDEQKRQKLLAQERELNRLLEEARAELALIDLRSEDDGDSKQKRQKLLGIIKDLRGLLMNVEDELIKIVDGEVIEGEVLRMPESTQATPQIKGLLMEHNPERGNETERVNFRRLIQEPENVNVTRLIEGNVSTEDLAVIEEEFPGQDPIRVIEGEVVDELNEKDPNPPRQEGGKRNAIVRAIAKRVKSIMLGLMVVGNFAVGTSFKAAPSAESLAYDKIKVESLTDWKNIVIDQEAINKLDNISIINKANESSGKTYLVVDKSVGMAHLYKGGNLVTSYEVGTGQQKGDDQTVTVVRDGKAYWSEGNRQTGAGIYTVNQKGNYEGAPSFTMTNERGIEVPTAFHKTVGDRARLFADNNTANNRMSNGCLNFLAGSLEDLAKRKDFAPGVKVYILPDDPHNKFELVDGELRFVSNGQNVNRTTKSYEAKPIILRAENPNEDGKTFLQTLSAEGNKKKMMGLYPTISNDVYNQLAKMAYGIFGQESSFGTYGGARGQAGRITDMAGIVAGRNVSAGVTQIRITSVNPKVRDAFGVRRTTDLLDVRKSALATLGLLCDIYTDNIPGESKGNYKDLVPLAYNNPGKFRQAVKTGNYVKSSYVNKVQTYADNVKIYSLSFEMGK